MATIAQVKRDRTGQANKVVQAMRAYDGAQERLERLLKRYRSKKRLIESTDMPALQAAFTVMNDKFSALETEMTNLYKMVASF